MALWEIIGLIVSLTIMLALIVLYYVFKAFLKRNSEKTVEEISPKLKRLTYILIAIVIISISISIIISTINLIIKFKAL